MKMQSQQMSFQSAAENGVGFQLFSYQCGARSTIVEPVLPLWSHGAKIKVRWTAAGAPM